MSKQFCSLWQNITLSLYFQVGVNVIGLPEIIKHEYEALGYIATLTES